jgi:hypothetical protein
VIGLAVWKGKTASWTEMMACNSRGCGRVFSVKRGKKAYWTEMMACNSRGCARIFSVKRGGKGLLDRNDGLQFKGLC